VINKQTQQLSRCCTVHPFNMPSLRVSAFDELSNLNESLAKYDVFARSVLYKLIRCYREYTEQDKVIPEVGDRHIHKYIPAFEWDRGRVPYVQKLPQLSQDIHERIVTTNDRLKTMVEKHKFIKQKLQMNEKNQEGNLMVCDLQKFIQPVHYIDGEYITSCFVVVPTAKAAEFEGHYWKLETTPEAEALYKRQNRPSNNDREPAPDFSQEEKLRREVACPDSHVKITEEGEFALYRVIVLKKDGKGVEWFRDVCREFRYTVREFELRDKETQDEEEYDRKKLEKEEKNKRNRLKMFCEHSFPDSLSDWLHLKMIRVFCESVLRFGLPAENHVITVLKVNPGMGSALAGILKSMYANLVEKNMMDGEDDGSLAMLGMSELRPYVFIPMMAGFD